MNIETKCGAEFDGLRNLTVHPKRPEIRPKTDRKPEHQGLAFGPLPGLGVVESPQYSPADRVARHARSRKLHDSIPYCSLTCRLDRDCRETA